MIYKKMEFDFWELLLKKIYPFWKEQGLIDDFGTFSPTAYVSVDFEPQAPMFDRNSMVDTVIKELQAGLTTKRRALMDLNPGIADDELDMLVQEIKDEELIEVIQYGTQQDRNQADSTNTEEL